MGFKISRYLPAVAAWFLLIGITGVFYTLVIPGIIKEFRGLGIVLTIGEALLLTGVIANFFMATVMDPGVIPKATESEEQQQDEFRAPLYKNCDVKGISVRMKWCTTCHFYRPPRCSHCSVCDHCIDSFDHHCPWLNNCIGRRNYKQFFIFLILLSLHIIAVISLCLMYTLKTKHNLVTKENLGSICVTVLGGLLFVPVFGLTGFHVFLVVTGRTTNEQVTGKFRSGYNPFDRGLCRNFALVCFGPQFPNFDKYMGKQETADLERMALGSAGNASGVEASAPLLNAVTVPVHNHRTPTITKPNIDPEQIQLYGTDAHEPLVSKRQLNDGNIPKFQQIKRLPSDVSSDGRSATGLLTGTERSRSSVASASRSRSSIGEQRSDEVSLGRDDGNLSRDSSMVTIRVFPKSGSVGFPPLLRPDDPNGVGTSSLEAQGSKCNLLDETGSALEAPGVLHAKRANGAGDTSSFYEEDGLRRGDECISSPGSERYQQALREAYSGAAVRHKPPVVIRSIPQSAVRRGVVQNGPVAPSYGGYNKNLPRMSSGAGDGIGGGDGVMRFAYVPPSSIMKSSVVNKSHSMDGLGRQAMVQSSIPSYQPSTPARLSLAPALSSSITSDYNYGGYKRPLSFTQAVQLHDSLTKLNSNNSGRTGTFVTRPRSDTAESSSSAQTSTINEIRV